MRLWADAGDRDAARRLAERGNLDEAERILRPLADNPDDRPWIDWDDPDERPAAQRLAVRETTAPDPVVIVERAQRAALTHGISALTASRLPQGNDPGHAEG